jgi:[ribosomal protein S5]-alanine N-acetyltransferase
MRLHLPTIESDRLYLRIATEEDIPQILDYFIDNKTFFTPFYPPWADNFFTEEYWQLQIEINIQEFRNDNSLRLFIFQKQNLRKVIGSVNFSNFIRGAAQYCNVGYSITEAEQGNGYMTEALKISIEYVFQNLKIHRIMANYMPHNQRSGNVLKNLGFVVEGYARDYLLIDGKWQDHILTSITNPHWNS